ncbi:NADAR family protein [Candidatus Dependentiae bacterium]|nr:NADAR family protein [Candidatus Dependentiae bacterium]
MKFSINLKNTVVALVLLSTSLSLNCWSGRVVPVAFNKTTQEWSILLGHDPQGYWSDFSLEANKGERGDTVAQKALSIGTNGEYTNTVTGTPWAKTPQNDILHIVKVHYTPRATLKKQGSNFTKDDFVWIPVSEFAQPQDISRRLANGTPVNVSRGVKKMINTYIDQALKELNKQRTAKKTQSKSNTTSQAAQSWFGIPGAIYFYTKGKPYYEFTNFAEGYPFILNGDTWYTSEQYYQAQKFVSNKLLYNTIRDFRTDKNGSAGKKAFDFAQSHKGQADQQWNKKSLNVMLDALTAKFDQNPALDNMLSSTKKAVLVEDSPVDFFFGAGKNGTGENHLGKLLMKIRK